MIGPDARRSSISGARGSGSPGPDRPPRIRAPQPEPIAAPSSSAPPGGRQRRIQALTARHHAPDQAPAAMPPKVAIWYSATARGHEPARRGQLHRHVEQRQRQHPGRPRRQHRRRVQPGPTAFWPRTRAETAKPAKPCARRSRCFSRGGCGGSAAPADRAAHSIPAGRQTAATPPRGGSWRPAAAAPARRWPAKPNSAPRDITAAGSATARHSAGPPQSRP